jgi:hypothetical protein
VQGGILLLAVVHRVKQSRILKKGAVLNLLRDSGKLLIHDASCAHVQVTHLRVSHLAVRQTHRHAAGISLHERALRHQFFHHRRLRQCNRIPLRLVIEAVAIQNHQYCRFLCFHD